MTSLVTMNEETPDERLCGSALEHDVNPPLWQVNFCLNNKSRTAKQSISFFILLYKSVNKHKNILK